MKKIKFKHTLFNRTPTPSLIKPYGVENLGNTCYMGCILSLFRNNKYLCEKLKTFLSEIQNDRFLSSLVNSSPTLYPRNVILYELNQCYIKKKDVINPSFFHIAFVKIYPRFKNKKVQNDAHEFFTCFWECVTTLENFCSTAKKDFPKPFTGAFNFSVNTKTGCLGCHGMTSKDDFNGICSISVPKMKITHLDSILKASFPKVGSLIEKSCVCGKNPKKKFKKLCFFKEIPKIFLIHLKRFCWNKEKKTSEKINTTVVVPEIISLYPFTLKDKKNVNALKNNENNVFRLNSIICHTGKTLSKGHFVLIRRNNSNLWEIINDASTGITKIKISHIRPEFVNDDQFIPNFIDNCGYILEYVLVIDDNVSTKKF